MRQVVLDTETTGIDPKQGHRIIEIGCVEVINRQITTNHYHQYINPDRKIDEEALKVHGISNQFLQDKPHFKEIAADFMQFIQGAELLIHNAPFDVGFINHELSLLSAQWQVIEQYCQITDTLVLARENHPGQKNSLDALCKRYDIDNSKRDLHGALLDSELLAEVYLRMTGGQVSLLGDNEGQNKNKQTAIRRISADRAALPILSPTAAELVEHENYLDKLDKKSGETCLWRTLSSH